MAVNTLSPPCPSCGAWITRIILTKYDVEGTSIVRRRCCDFCEHRFYTSQQVEQTADVKWHSVSGKKRSIPYVTKLYPVVTRSRKE